MQILRRKEYTFNYPAIAWKRAAPDHKRGHMYDTQKMDKITVGLDFKKQHDADGDAQPFNGPLHAHITFYLNSRTVVKNRGPLDYYHTEFPDIDNVEGFLWDCAKQAGIITDDRIIASVIKQKLIDRINPRTVLVFQELPR